MDEVFREANFVGELKFKTTSNRTADFVASVYDTVLWYAINREALKQKFRRLFRRKTYEDVTDDSYGCVEENTVSWRRLTRREKDDPLSAQALGPLFGLGDLTSSHEYTRDEFAWEGKVFGTKRRYWSTSHADSSGLGEPTDFAT